MHAYVYGIWFRFVVQSISIQTLLPFFCKIFLALDLLACTYLLGMHVCVCVCVCVCVYKRGGKKGLGQFSLSLSLTPREGGRKEQRHLEKRREGEEKEWEAETHQQDRRARRKEKNTAHYIAYAEKWDEISQLEPTQFRVPWRIYVSGREKNSDRFPVHFFRAFPISLIYPNVHTYMYVYGQEKIPPKLEREREKAKESEQSRERGREREREREATSFCR